MPFRDKRGQYLTAPFVIPVLVPGMRPTPVKPLRRQQSFCTQKNGEVDLLGTEDCAPSQQFDLQIKVDCSEQADPKTERAQTESHTFLIRNFPPLRRN